MPVNIEEKIYKSPVATASAISRLKEHRGGEWASMPVEGGYKIIEINGNNGSGNVTAAAQPTMESFQDETIEEAPRKRGRASWKPGNMLDIPMEYRHPDYVYKAVNAKKPGRVMKLKSEGWEIDKELSKKGFFAGGVADGHPVDGSTVIGDLTIMRLHKETKAAREDYYKELTRRQTEGAVESHGNDISDKERYGEGLKLNR